MTKLTDKKIVGLIGMSGAGKSTICERFIKQGFCVIDCDKVSREVVQKGSKSLCELKAELSSDIIKSDGTLDRKLTAEIVFNNYEKRMTFNRIIYPYIAYNVMQKIKSCESDVLLDAPTLFDARLEGICDNIVSVCADREICIERIIKRDGISKELAAARLNSQHDIDWYKNRSDYCIINNGTQLRAIQCCDEIILSLKGL